jgi:hypothetical protein
MMRAMVVERVVERAAGMKVPPLLMLSLGL